jgi:hypothetical protein
MAREAGPQEEPKEREMAKLREREGRGRRQRQVHRCKGTESNRPLLATAPLAVPPSVQGGRNDLLKMA